MTDDERRERIAQRFAQALDGAGPVVNAYIRGMSSDVRTRNPFLFVCASHDVPPPAGVAAPPGMLGIGFEVVLVYAADIDTAIDALPGTPSLRDRMRGHVRDGLALSIGRLPFVRVLLYDSEGTACAFGRVDDADLGSHPPPN